MSDESYCDLHDWKTIGTITTGNGMLAIVPPYYAGTLAEWWDAKLRALQTSDNPRLLTRQQFEEVSLRQITTSLAHPEGYQDSEQAFVFQTGNGGWDVEARFCDLYGSGHLDLCELRIRLHSHEDDDDR
jgi:hypothetical protein